MKELSIEEKAKAYDEVIEKLRDFYRDYDTVSHLIDVKEELANLFPELKEPKEEQIRKRLIKAFGSMVKKQWDGIAIEDILAWLEKQGNKSVNIDIESMISSYKQRLKSQGSIENTPLFDICLTAFRHGVENVLEELNLKTLDPDKVIEWFRFNWWDSHIGNPIAKFKKDFEL